MVNLQDEKWNQVDVHWFCLLLTLLVEWDVKNDNHSGFLVEKWKSTKNLRVVKAVRSQDVFWNNKWEKGAHWGPERVDHFSIATETAVRLHIRILQLLFWCGSQTVYWEWACKHQVFLLDQFGYTRWRKERFKEQATTWKGKGMDRWRSAEVISHHNVQAPNIRESPNWKQPS